MNEDGHTSSVRDKILTITVKKGWKPGTKITFTEEGDQGPNNVPGNKYFSGYKASFILAVITTIDVLYDFD